MVCLSSNNEWVSISPAHFKILIVMIQNPVEFEKVCLRRLKVDIEFVRFSEIIAISQISNFYVSTIVLNSNLCALLLKNFDSISEMVTM